MEGQEDRLLARRCLKTFELRLPWGAKHCQLAITTDIEDHGLILEICGVAEVLRQSFEAEADRVVVPADDELVPVP